MAVSVLGALLGTVVWAMNLTAPPVPIRQLWLTLPHHSLGRAPTRNQFDAAAMMTATYAATTPLMTLLCLRWSIPPWILLYGTFAGALGTTFMGQMAYRQLWAAATSNPGAPVAAIGLLPEPQQKPHVVPTMPLRWVAVALLPPVLGIALSNAAWTLLGAEWCTPGRMVPRGQSLQTALDAWTIVCGSTSLLADYWLWKTLQGRFWPWTGAKLVHLYAWVVLTGILLCGQVGSYRLVGIPLSLPLYAMALPWPGCTQGLVLNDQLLGPSRLLDAVAGWALAVLLWVRCRREFG